MYSKSMSKSSKTDLPSVFAFLDYRAFLEAWFAAKQAANPRFSHRAFARRAGQKSPSLLLHVMQGKRNLTQATLESFCTAMRLSATESRFFSALVELDQARTDEARNSAFNRISAERRFRDARRIDGAFYDYLSHWYIPAIRELVGREDFRDDPKWIASVLRPKIKASQARSALQTLSDLGMIEHTDNGIRMADPTVRTSQEIQGLAVHNYHREMCARAGEAISGSKAVERHMLGVTVGIPAELVPQLKDEISGFQARLLDLCDAAVGVERAYQINLQLFPLSEPMEPS